MSDTFEAPEPFLPITNDPFHAYGGFINPEDPFKQYGGYRIDPLNPYIVQFHHKFAPLFTPMRYKIMEGGRGSMKSWAAARALIIISLIYKKRIVCAREHMNTIEDSVHRLLTDQIEAMGLLLPPLLLQPLVENAIRHGIANLPEGGVIGLTVRRDADSVSILVENSFDPDTPSAIKTGLGLDNVRRRLHARYGDNAHVAYGADGDLFSVSLRLPAQQNGDRT